MGFLARYRICVLIDFSLQGCVLGEAQGKLRQREDASFADAPHTRTYTLALANPTQPIPTLASLQSHLQKSVGLQCFLKLLIRAVVKAAEIQMGALYGETTQLTFTTFFLVLSRSFKKKCILYAL